MAVDETLLDEIVRRILSVAHPDRIILFGSAATGHMTKDSDIDLLVVESAPANTHERIVEIRAAVGDIGYPVDVIVMRTERFERTKRVIGGIAYPANKYGRAIYEAKQERWDAELDRDASSGKLDFLIAEAQEDRKQARLKGWPDPE